MPLDVNEFASKIKEKYPEYKDVDNKLLAQKMIEKYPEYKDKVSLEAPKKKEATESQLKQPKASSSSDTQGTEEQKPSVSSGSVKNNVFTGYPGKEGKKYQLKDGVWYEYSSTIPKEGGKNIDLYEKPITNVGRVDALNSFFKQKAYYNQQHKTETKLKDKIIEEQKALKGQGHNVDINGLMDDKTLIAKNKDQAKVVISEKEKARKEKVLTSIDSYINKGLIGNEEEQVVSFLRNKFSKDGFIFEESGAGDNLSISYRANGVTTKAGEISLDNWTTGGDIEEMNKLKSFMKNAYMTTSERKEVANASNVRDLVKLMGRNPLKYGKEVVSEDVFTNHIDKSYMTLSLEQKRLKDDYKQLDLDIQKYNENPSSEKLKEIQNRKSELSVREYAIVKEYGDIKNATRNYSKAVGTYTADKAKEGNFAGIIAGGLAQGLTNIEKMVAETAIDVIPYLSAPVDPMTEQKLKATGYTDAQIKDYAAKELKQRLLPKLKEGIQNVATVGTTTQEYVQSKDRNDIEKTANFLSESIGTALSAGGNPTLQKIAFFSQSYNAMEEQMMNGSDFEGLTENQKKLVSVPYGIVIGALEKLGFEIGTGQNAALNGAVSKVIARTFTELPKDASIQLIEKTLAQNAKTIIAQGVARVGVSALSEGLVEGVQNVAETGEKYLVNKIEGFDYFQNVPDITTSEGIKAALNEAKTDAYYGALGGLVMSGLSQSYNAAKNGFNEKQNDLKFEDWLDGISDDKLVQATKLDIKTKLANGDITKEQAQEQIEGLDKARALLNEIPAEYSVRDKRTSFNLIQEKKKLEKDIQGKDEASVFAQKERINAINEELKTISLNNATKESTEQQQEIPTESNISERQGATEGQQEVREGEGSERTATQPEANISDSNIPSEEAQVVDYTSKTDKELYDIQSKYEESDNENEQQIFSDSEKELERREKDKVFSVPLSEVSKVLDELRLQEKNMPNGFGIFTDLEDLSESKIVAERYLSPEKLSDREVESDFMSALRGNPKTWYADGLKLRESVKESGNRGVSFEDLINKAKQLYINDGYDVKVADEIISSKLAPIFGEQKAEYNKSAQQTEEQVIPSIETKIEEYEQRTENEVVAPNIETTKTKKAKSIPRTKKALEVETNDLQDIVKKHFISGGKINVNSAMQSLFGNKNGKSIASEYRKRIGLHHRLGSTVDGLAHLLWEQNRDTLGDSTTTMEWRDAIESVLTDNVGTKNMIDSLLAKSEESVTDAEAKYWEDKYDLNALEGFDESELMDAESVLDNMTNEEMAKMYDEIIASEQAEYNPTLDEIKNLDVTDKTNLQKVQSFLDNALNDLDAFGKETLGMNLPVAVARVVLKTVKTLVDAGVSLEQAFKQAAQKHNVKEVDIADTLTALSNKKKDTQASTAAKNISKKPVTKVTVNEATALKDQLKLEVKAAREGAKSVKDQQNELLDKVRKMGSKGVITTRQTRALLNKIRKLNLNNDVAVNDFFKYSEKIFNDAEYAEKLGRANNLRKSAKKKVKNKDNNQGPIIALVNDFAKINTDNVADLDEYIEMANKLNNAAKSSRVTKLGVAFKEATSIAEANAYITKELERQEKETKRELLRKFDDLVRNGLISDSMTLKEMEEFIKLLDGEEDVESKEEKEALTREYVKAKFDELSASIKDILDSDDTISDADRKLMSDVLGIDLDNVGIRDSFRFVEAMDNFQMNGITSGVEAMMRSYTGVENAKELQSSGFKSFVLKRLFSKAYGKFRAKQTYSLPILFENMFAGESAARVFMKKSGYNDVANGKVSALVKHNEKLREHKKLFSKSKPNGKNFNDAENIHERGIFAYLIRSVNDDPTAVDSMFQKRLDNVKRTIENHRNTKSEKHQKIADSLEKVAKKMGIFEDNPTIESIESKVDEINKKDIQWWVDSWSEIYPELSDVSLSVYNTVLARDAFYTTDTIGNINRKFDLTDETGGFSVNTADTKKTGVLHENNRFKIGEKNSDSIIDFNFDANQDKAFKAALVDVNTAGPIRQLKAFMDSKYISDIVATKEDLEVLKERLYNYVKRTKGKAVSEDDIKASASFNRKLNRLSLLNTSLILGRPSQYLLQTVPIIANTMLNTSTVGRFDIGDAVSRSAIKFLSRTNRTIAIRALDARAHIEKAERYLDKNPEALSEKAGDVIDKVNEFWLKYTLQNADVWVANASWLTYYQDYLHKNKGIATGSIDWDSHEVDEDAADYAQQKVDRQQNISDPHMAGEWQQSSSATKKILTKVIMPFSNFAMNQKSRLNADLRALRFGTAEDRKEARFSIIGMATEQVIFRGVQAAIHIGLHNLGASLFGYDDDDEEKEKIKKRYLDSSVKQGLSDVLSPNPALDGLTVSAINFLSESSETVRGMFSDDTELNNAVKEKNAQLEEEGKPIMGEKEEIVFRDKYIQENIWRLDDFVSDDKLGMFGIAVKKGGQFKDLVQKVNSENGFMVENKMTKEETRKFLIPEDRKKLQSALVLDAAYLLRALPTEVNAILTNQEKSITKRALNAKQYDNYEQIKKEYKKDLSANWRYDLIQSSKSINSIMNGIEMFDDYNMTEKKYDDFKAAKKIAKDKKISWDDKSLSYFILDELDAGRKPSQIKFE